MGVDVIVLRHAAAGSAELLARSVKCSVINAGDGHMSTRRRACSTSIRSANASGGSKA